MPEAYTFEIVQTRSEYSGTYREVPQAHASAETFQGCAVNLAEAVETALQESEPFLAVKTVTLAARAPQTIRSFNVKIIHSPEGFAIGCLDLPGCWSQGNSEEEAMANIREAIRDYLEVAEEVASQPEGQIAKVA